MTHIFYLQLILTSYSKYVKLDFFNFFLITECWHPLLTFKQLYDCTTYEEFSQ